MENYPQSCIENYMKNYDTFDKHLIYNFGIDVKSGGIGDLTSFFTHFLKLCIDNNIKIHYLVKNSFIEKYLKLKYEKMYITDVDINSVDISNIDHLDEISGILPDKYYYVRPDILYSKFSMDRCGTQRGQRGAAMIPFQLKEIFYFTPEVIINIPEIFKTVDEYISIHIRLGDDSMVGRELNYNSDTRVFNYHKLINFISKNSDKNIFLACDNITLRNEIKEQFSNIMTTNYDISHTAWKNTTELQTLNTLSEFYLLSNSKEIYLGSYSGFSIMASKFKNIPIFDIDDL